MPRTKTTKKTATKESKRVENEVDIDESVEEQVAAVTKTKRAKTESVDIKDIPDHTRLSTLLSKRAIFKTATFWLVGDTPLITHAWSEKAKREMLSKQVKAVRAAREARDPENDFVNSLYEMGSNCYGFPVTGVKNAILSVSHKDKGIARSSVMSALFLKHRMVRLRPALAGAICDLPLIRVWGAEPEMREDMVKIGQGLNKTASLAYRGQFFPWAMRLQATLNAEILTPNALMFLVQEAGLACGLGEWRNEKKGVFGAFHMASVEEESEWEAYARGNGPLPKPLQDNDDWDEFGEPVPKIAAE